MLNGEKTVKARLIGYASLLALLGGIVAFFVAGRGTDTGSAAVAEERFTNYRQPTGPELTPEEAMERAIQRVLLLEKATSPLANELASGTAAVEVAHSNLATVRAIEQGRQPSEASATGSDLEQTEMLRSSVYLVKMKGQFSPAVPTPRGAPMPHGSVISLTLDAHTGFVMGLQLGGAPEITAIGPVAKFSIGAGSGRATVAESLDQRHGLLFGTAYHAGSTVSGWRIVVAARGHHASTHTTTQGGFLLRLPAGVYTVTALRPNGTPCAKRIEHVFRRHNSYTALSCS